MISLHIALQNLLQQLQYLCETISERHLGSHGNKEATEYFKKVLQQNRWKTEESLLEVMG